MTGLGQVTNTRTADVALGDMIKRLEVIDQTRAVTRLLAEARRYHGIMQSWETQPPASGDQFQIISDVMQLLGTASQMVEAAGADPGVPVPRTTPAGTAPVHRPTPVQATPAQAVKADAVAVQVGPAAPRERAEPAVSASQPAATPFAAKPSSSSQPRKHRIGMVTRQGAHSSEEPSEAAPAPPSSSGIRLLRPYMMPWQQVAGSPGVVFKLLHDDPADGHSHALARLESGAELLSHTHGSSEYVYVLEGCITHGDASVHAGECVCFEAGSASGPLRSRGESLLLLICSDRTALKA
jgi:hypothetical protein